MSATASMPAASPAEDFVAVTAVVLSARPKSARLRLTVAGGTKTSWVPRSALSAKSLMTIDRAPEATPIEIEVRRWKLEQAGLLASEWPAAAARLRVLNEIAHAARKPLRTRSDFRTGRSIAFNTEMATGSALAKADAYFVAAKDIAVAADRRETLAALAAWPEAVAALGALWRQGAPA